MSNRQVFPRDTVAHKWAHATQESARDPGGNFYFTGAKIYSYGSHFLCAYRVPDALRAAYGVDFIVNADSYSMTTQRHMASVHAAIRGTERVTVPGLKGDHVYNVEMYGMRDVALRLIEAMKSAAKDAATPRAVAPATRAASLAAAERYADNARRLLQGDIARKDFSAEAKKARRVTLRTIPTNWPQNVEDMTRKDAAACVAEFVAPIMREEFRREFERSAAGFAARAERFDRYTGGYRADYSDIKSASEALETAHSGAEFFRNAEHFAKLARVRVPAEMRKRAAAMAKRVPELKALDAKETRDASLRRFTYACMKAREQIAVAPGSYLTINAIHEVRNAAAACAALDTPEEQAARMATHAELEQRAKTASDATAEQRAAELFTLAREKLDAGETNAARSSARSAWGIAAGGATTPEQTAAAKAQWESIERAADEADAARHAATIAAWRAGNGGTLPESITGGEAAGALLRVKGDAIQTSRGADVPLSVAPIVWRAVNAARNAGEPVTFPRESAPRLGSFTLDEIAANGDITAGCHVIRFAELARIADVLGYSREVTA